MKNIMCDFDGCTKEVCEEDLQYTPPTKRFCKQHSQAFDDAIEETNVQELLSLWVKSLGGAKKAAGTMPPCRPTTLAVDEPVCSRCGENVVYENGVCWDCLDG